MIPPTSSYAWSFSLLEFFWNTEGFLDEVFRYCKTKNFDGKSWLVPLLSYSWIFWIPDFFWNSRVPQRIFCGTVSHQILKENSDSPSYAWHFSIRIVFEVQKGSPTTYDFYWCGGTNFRRKVVILASSPPPPSHAWKVSIPEFFCNQKGFPYEISSVLWDKFSTHNRDSPLSPPSSYAWKVSIPEFSWNQKGFPYEVFQYWETIVFRRRIVIPASPCSYG